ncbi:SNF2 helicase associated domain-containing protein [Clostridium sp. B9]|uniref:DEAD/DEAH box helicase n=1 Tax=Clostridium sp. B9 TaxID=3423224 RepID=UPI003D2F4E59
MSVEDLLLQRFKEETSGRNYSKGQRIVINDLVESIDICKEDDLISISGEVISEQLFSKYSTKLEMDIKTKGILSTYCTCADYEKHEFSKDNYCCKHLVATFYKSLSDLAKDKSLAEKKKMFLNKKENSLLDLILQEEREKEELKIEVYINKNEWSNSLLAEFKIGTKSMGSNKLYILKDIEQFLVSYYNKIPVKYSKSFTFNIKEQRLSCKDKELLEFIETLKEIEKPIKSFLRNRDTFIDGKFIKIPNYMVREFFNVIKNHRVYLNEGFFYRAVEGEILYEDVPVDFSLKENSEGYELTSPNGMPKALGEKKDVFLYGTTIYIPRKEFCYKLNNYLNIFQEGKGLNIDKSEEERVYRKLIPALREISERVNLSKSIMKKTVLEPVKFNFYFDKDGKEVTLTLKVKYGAYEFNIFDDCKEKIIYRDIKREKEVLGLLERFSLEEINNKFYFLRGDEYIFSFFKYDIDKLQKVGEVYYSENFKGIKSIGSKGIKGEIKPGRYNYLEFDFKIGDIPSSETKEILKAFRDNIKFYKLKSGEYLDLEEIELNQFLKLIDSMDIDSLADNKLELGNNRAIYIANYIEEHGIRYIKGKKKLNEIKNKFKNINKLEFEIPNDLKAELREYQKFGYNWLKTLEHLGLGGILGDEMGLGKTLQAITFILSNKGKKTLVVAPTSLIYNWKEEMEKFAPSLKVEVLNDCKSKREETLKNISDTDVIITTYNLLKRDLDEYKKIRFDYCFIDEAQAIKNPDSQNSEAVKDVNAEFKFALSGTPMENSLMELWSIFDFIMPGYLYDRKRFTVRYYKKLNESEDVLNEIHSLIKPFILRRKKKDVIKELPDKIEKRLLVDLGEEQKKVYSIYANNALAIMEKKQDAEEFNKSKIEILSYITKLRQLALDPSVAINDYDGESAKIEALIEVLNQGIEEGHKILVFSQFTSVLKNISKRLEGEKISFSYLDGSISSKKRVEMVNDFNSGNNSVFLISLKAGGTGLNLTSADIVIHFDPWWNPAVEDQATDRAHRIGQKNIVEVIKLIAKGTIEEKVVALQEEKKALISKVIEEGELGAGNAFNSLSEDELMDLFKVDYLV